MAIAIKALKAHQLDTDVTQAWLQCKKTNRDGIIHRAME